MFENKKTRYWVVIPAAGIGSRMYKSTPAMAKKKCPKQYLKLYDGRTVLEHTIAKFQQIEEISGICVCLAADDEFWQKLPNMDGVCTTNGGKERADSVLNGLRFWQQQNASADDWVLVHDAARPAIDTADIRQLISGLAPDADGAILATPVRDTLKKQRDNALDVAQTVDRQGLWQAQTPQMFRLAALKKALTTWVAANEPITDEAQAMEKMGHKVQLLEGNPNNLKLTQSEDLALINWLCQQQADNAQ